MVYEYKCPKCNETYTRIVPVSEFCRTYPCKCGSEMTLVLYPPFFITGQKSFTEQAREKERQYKDKERYKKERRQRWLNYWKEINN